MNGAESVYKKRQPPFFPMFTIHNNKSDSMKLTGLSAVKLTEPKPAVGSTDLLGLQFPLESPPSTCPKLDDPDSTITVNYGSDMKKTEEKGDEGPGSKMEEEGDEGSESEDVWSCSKPIPEEGFEEIFKVKEEDKKPGGGVSLCVYCFKRGSELDHPTFHCPLKLKAWAKYCSKCHDLMNYGPCKLESGHEDALYDHLLCCNVCGCLGDPHDTEDCPKLKARGIDFTELTDSVV